MYTVISDVCCRQETGCELFGGDCSSDLSSSDLEVIFFVSRVHEKRGEVEGDG